LWTGIGLIAGLAVGLAAAGLAKHDHPWDMLRTMTNVAGHLTAALVVARTERGT
jgi:Na+/H+-dicarboxylate symporter